MGASAAGLDEDEAAEDGEPEEEPEEEEAEEREAMIRRKRGHNSVPWDPKKTTMRRKKKMTPHKRTMNFPSRKTNTAGHRGQGSPAATRYVCC